MDTEQSVKQRQELTDRIIAKFEGDNLIQTDLDSLSFYVNPDKTGLLATLYEPSLCIIAQGAKEVTWGDRLLHYEAGMYLLASVHTPAHVRIIEASREKPYAGLTITFSMEQIFDVLKEIDSSDEPLSDSSESLYVAKMDARLQDAVLRLVRLLDTPEDIKVLAPLITKEILYMVMRTEGVDLIRQYIREGSLTQRVVKAITGIKEEFSEKLNVKELAKSVGMSESSLYANFKKITRMTPIQFQKQLRLQEARRILLTQEVEIAQAAFEVGYESPSQFSREYSRMFGLPPKEDVKRMHGL